MSRGRWNTSALMAGGYCSPLPAASTFARGYRDARSGKLLDFGTSAWRVPDGLHLMPAWLSAAPVDWLAARVRAYRA
jgi:hypothetical protein